MKIDITGIENDIPLQMTMRAHAWISFDPERAGALMRNGYIQTLTNLAQIMETEAVDHRQQGMSQELFERMRQRYKRLFLDYVSATARCMSSAITGGSNFPVARAEKAGKSRHDKLVKVLEFEKGMKEYVLKRFNTVYSNAELQSSDFEITSAAIASRLKMHEEMKAANAFYRALKKNPNAPRPENLSDEMIESIKACDKPPFAEYQMRNNLVNVRRMKKRLVFVDAKIEGKAIKRS
jgi:hypothetical protein